MHFNATVYSGVRKLQPIRVQISSWRCEQALTLLTVFNHTRPRHYYRGLKYRRWRCRKCYLHRDDVVVGADVLDVGVGTVVAKLVHVLVAINTYVDELYRKPIQLNLVISKSRGPIRNVRYTCTISLTSLSLPARRCALFPSVSVWLCLSQVAVLSKGMDGLIWFLAWRLLSTSPTLL